MDLHRVHEKISQINPVSYEEMLAAASLVARQPREQWPLLAGMLGLDGVPTTLNKKARLEVKAVVESVP